jgi:hypothetical protein
MRTQLPLLVAVPAALVLAACGEEHGHEDPDVEACEHLADGPFVPVTATSMPATAPAIDDNHMAYTITLPGGAAGNTGYVSFAADELGYYGVYLDAGVTLAFSSSSGDPITPVESGTSSAACAEIMGRHMVPFEVGTARIQLTSATLTEVNVVIEHHAEHEH